MEIDNKYKPIGKRIDRLLKAESTPILIGIDGMCAAGKTTLGYYLHKRYDCNLFHMDDFFLQSHQRTRERLREIGGNVDYERFKEEVITPIINKQSVLYRPYRCDIGEINEGREIRFKRLNIVEGSYCQHPYFGDIYQMKIFMTLPESMQADRIRERNGNRMLGKFITEWIPKENEYFEKYRIGAGSIRIEEGLEKGGL